MRLRAVLLVTAIAVCLPLALAPAVGAKKTPKVGVQVSATANLSPIGDYVQFSVGAVSKSKACALRSIEIRRPAGNVLLDTLKTASPSKSGARWSASGIGEFIKIAGFVTSGETLRAETPQKKLKKGGKVTAICKPASASLQVP